MNLMEKVKGVLNWGIEEDFEEFDAVSERTDKTDKNRFSRADGYRRLHATHSDRADGQNSFDKTAKKEKVRRGFFGDPDKKIISIVDEEIRVANLRLMSFEDARKVDSHLKLGRTVLVDVSSLDLANGQRSIDFICGIIEALEANIQKMPNAPIFVITPCGTSIVGDVNDEFKYKGVFPWVK